MGEKQDRLEDLRESGDKQAGDKVAGETLDGREKQAQDVKDYYQARKDGLRDRYTQELLPPQPTFYDSQGDGQQAQVQTADYRAGDGTPQMVGDGGKGQAADRAAHINEKFSAGSSGIMDFPKISATTSGPAHISVYCWLRTLLRKRVMLPW